MRRTTASVQFRTQVGLVYLQYISAKIHSTCTSQPKIAKNSLETPSIYIRFLHSCLRKRGGKKLIKPTIKFKF